jgi:hypothetical protein
MHFLAAIALPALCSIPSVAAANMRRDTDVTKNLYAYGTESGGVPVFYADGKLFGYLGLDFTLTNRIGVAYAGYTAPTWASVVTNITSNLPFSPCCLKLYVGNVS